MKEEIQDEALDLSSQALRVLAFAFKQKDQQEIETNLIFLGAFGMIDPPHHVQKRLNQLKRHMKQELE